MLNCTNELALLNISNLTKHGEEEARDGGAMRGRLCLSQGVIAVGEERRGDSIS